MPDEVKELAQRLKDEFGKIHILVNDIWGAGVLKGGATEWNTPVWELDLAKGLRILRLAIDTHIITSKYLYCCSSRSPVDCSSKSLTALRSTTPRITTEFRSITTWQKSR